jgi:hypothetical protein
MSYNCLYENPPFELRLEKVEASTAWWQYPTKISAQKYKTKKSRKISGK